jgi:2-dehydropantoate 2-reductase
MAMKIAIMGTGGVGGYYGGLLAQKGHDVSFIARGAHLAAIQENGLQVKSIHGDFQVKPAQATDDPAQVGPVNLVVFCTKTYSIDEAAHLIKPLVASDTTVLPLQNGIDAAERIGANSNYHPLAKIQFHIYLQH